MSNYSKARALSPFYSENKPTNTVQTKSCFFILAKLVSVT